MLSSLNWPQAKHDYWCQHDTIEGASASSGFRYRVMLVVQAAPTSNLSSELAMFGYFHQSQALLRSLAETHKRMLFVRAIPSGVFQMLTAPEADHLR
jgi:hypothetical protein